MARRAYRSGRVQVRGGRPAESTAIPKPLLIGGVAVIALLSVFLWTRLRPAAVREEAPPPVITETLVSPIPVPGKKIPEKPVKAAPVLGLPAPEKKIPSLEPGTEGR